MEKPLRRLRRVLEELPMEMQIDIGMAAPLFLKMRTIVTPITEPGPDQGGVSIRMPAPVHICGRIRRLSAKSGVSEEQLIMTLLRGLRKEFERRENAARAHADRKRGRERLQYLQEQSSKPMDDRDEMWTDRELRWSADLTKEFVTHGPEHFRSMNRLASAIRRIIRRDFNREYWEEVRNA